MIFSEDAARSWIARADQARDEIDRFMALWIALNSLYNDIPANSERGAIRGFVDKNLARLGRETTLAILRLPGATFFHQRIIRDVRGDGRDTAEHAAILRNESRSTRERLKALLMITYQVRCNLFHGNKLYGRDSDHQVVRNAAELLQAILQALVGDLSKS